MDIQCVARGFSLARRGGGDPKGSRYARGTEASNKADVSCTVENDDARATDAGYDGVHGYISNVRGETHE